MALPEDIAALAEIVNALTHTVYQHVDKIAAKKLLRDRQAKDETGQRAASRSSVIG